MAAAIARRMLFSPQPAQEPSPADQSVVVVAHHQHVAQSRGLGILRVRIAVESQKLLRRVGQQIEERRAGLVFGVDLFGLVHHLQRLVVAASGDTRGTAFAQVGDEDGEDAARPRLLALRSGEDGVDLLVGHGNFVDDGEELALGLGREAVHVGHDLAENLRQRRAGILRDGVGHHLPSALVDLGEGLHHLSALARDR